MDYSQVMLHHHKEVPNQISNYGFMVAPGLLYKIIVDAEIVSYMRLFFLIYNEIQVTSSRNM